ncbi:helix-turn-helix transcriptional regulator [Photobacterium sp. SDRW27]|uniref:AraC family transcriptional regulator n=1 Tax=Photobacterium obscurum TaxID=2829490 RepID=UPI002243DF59|nr:helix-turn-helix transcriptional regulator [Photobacterium obscurum]MCW8329234.1 helix-turn-helix transcriptional regulator [Photobacterium obscurum]
MPTKRQTEIKAGLSQRGSNAQIADAGEQRVLARQVDMPPGHQGTSHSHTWYQLMYASEGVLNVEVSGQTMVVPPQRAVWLPPECVHRTYTPHGAKFRSLYFRPDQAGDLGHSCKVFSITNLTRELILAVVERCDIDTQWRQQDFNLLTVLLDQLSAQPQDPLSLLMPQDPRLDTLVETLQISPENDLSMQQWASKLGVSSRTLTRIFLSETGMGFREWRQRLRLLHSLTLLEKGKPVTQVALDVGYTSPSAFAHAFQQCFDCSPREYFR